MACNCSHEPAPIKKDSKFRTALWIALFINLAMFLVELIGGAYAHSSALWADSLDFFGDSVNYAVSLAVLGAGLYWRATVALVKGAVMALFGFVVIGKVIYAYMQGIPPEAMTMGAIGVLALIANVTSAVVLYTFRDGDSNMQSDWQCCSDICGHWCIWHREYVPRSDCGIYYGYFRSNRWLSSNEKIITRAQSICGRK